MQKVTYRPAGWLVYQGQLDAEAERLILTEMLKGCDGLRTSLYGPFEYDDVLNPEQLPERYIKRHGFNHPICGLVDPIKVSLDNDLKNRIQKALAAPSWSEGVKDAAMLLYLWRAFQQRTNKLIARSSKNDSTSALLKHKDRQRLSDLKAVFRNLQNHLASMIPEMKYSHRK